MLTLGFLLPAVPAKLRLEGGTTTGQHILDTCKMFLAFLKAFAMSLARSLRCCRRRLRLLLLPEAVRPAFRPASALLLQRHQHSQGHQGRSWLAMVAGTNGGQHVGQVGAHVLAERGAVRGGCAGSGQAVRAARPGAGGARRHFLLV